MIGCSICYPGRIGMQIDTTYIYNSLYDMEE